VHAHGGYNESGGTVSIAWLKCNMQDMLRASQNTRTVLTINNVQCTQASGPYVAMSYR